MPSIWKFILEYFGKMPQWVQVSTYLALLFLCIYLYLAPTFANGQLVAVTEAGGRLPYRGIDMSVHVGGRNLKFKTNEAGYWSIPIVSRFPEKVRVNIFHEDQHAWFPVVLTWMDLWRGNFEIQINNQEPFFEVELVDKTSNTGVQWIVQVPELVRDAHGAELLVPARILDRGKNPELERETQRKVYAIVAALQNWAPAKVDANTSFSGSNGLSYIKRIQAIEDIERGFAIKIPDEHWRSIDTVGGIADYVYKRKLLAQESPALYDSKRSWPQVQQSAPAEQRAVFK